MINITDQITIPDSEVTFTTARSSGPGGQHVNKVSSRVTLHFNILTSQSLSADQKQRLLSRLRTRISKEGVLRVVAQKHRSQAANRQAAMRRFSARRLLSAGRIAVRKGHLARARAVCRVLAPVQRTMDYSFD